MRGSMKIWISVLLWMSLELWDYGHTSCIPVYNTFQHCIRAPSTVVTLSCPFDHTVRITSATYYLSDSPSCDPATARSDNGCTIQDVMVDITVACVGKVQCHVEVAKRSEVGSCGAEEAVGGQHMLEVTYSCTQARPLTDVDLCTPETVTDNYVHIQSTRNMQTDLYTTDCYCILTSTTDMEIETDPLFFRRIPHSTTCDQRIVLNDVDTRSQDVEFCLSSDPNNYECMESGQRRVLRYVSSDESVGARFVVSVKSSHDAMFTVQCGLRGFTTPPLTTTTTTTTTTTPEPTTTTTTTATTTTTTTTTTTPEPTTTTTTTKKPTTTTTTEEPTTTTTTTTKKPTTTTTKQPKTTTVTTTKQQTATTTTTAPFSSSIDSTTTIDSGTASRSRGTSMGAILGGTLGGAVFFVLLVFIIIVLCICRKQLRFTQQAKNCLQRGCACCRQNSLVRRSRKRHHPPASEVYDTIDEDKMDRLSDIDLELMERKS